MLSRQWLFGVLLATSATSAALAGAQQPSGAVTRLVTLDGRQVRVRLAGLERRKRGSPVVVFEAGAMNTLDTWQRVLPNVAAVAPVIAYDRAGLGQSAWDSIAPTPRHVVTRLRRMLRDIGAEPPYVLVGHSWGGSLMRFYAGYHPTEVAGVVYVDPGPIITQAVADEIAPFNAIGAGRAGYEAFWSLYAAMVQRASSPAVRAEFDVYRALVQRDLSARDLAPAPAVPAVVIVAAKPNPSLAGLPYDVSAHFQADLRHRVRMLQEWALASPRGTLVMSNHTNHAVLREDPDLVVWAVRRVLAAVPTRP